MSVKSSTTSPTASMLPPWPGPPPSAAGDRLTGSPPDTHRAPETVLEVLRDRFGHAAFRAGQDLAVSSFLAGRDVQLLLPTGGGKSLCFQVPALVRAARGDGPTLVVSPLIALMEDQLAALRRRGVAAEVVHSHQRWEEQREALARSEGAALLYVSPERARSPRFRRWLGTRRVAALVVDEAHCISEWGHDHRPDYLHLGELRDLVAGPAMALTATATPRVMEEIAASLRLRSPVVIRGGFTRDNLVFSVELHEGDRARVERLAELLEVEGLGRDPLRGRAVVYAATRKRVREVSDALRKRGFSAGYYHAGRTEGVRTRVQEAFEQGGHAVLVATTAFGMGIDQPDVRLVAHVQAPGTLEAYTQQAGRAGRDRAPARCVLLFGPGDVLTQARIRGPSPPPGVEVGWNALLDYAYGTTCRQSAIVRHFTGEPSTPCGRCDACTAPEAVGAAVGEARGRLRERRDQRADRRARDLSVELDEAQLGLVLAFVDAMKKPLGRTLVAAGLRGSRARRAARAGVQHNPHHGALQGVPEVAIVRALEQLLADGRLAARGKKYPTVWMPGKRVRPAGPAKEREESAPAGLKGKLRAFRRQEASGRRWRAYQVFTNRTLDAIAASRPKTERELLAVPGMGPRRLERFGSQILELVAADADAQRSAGPPRQ